MPLRMRFVLLLVAILVTAAPGCGRLVPELPSANQLSNQATIRRDTYGIPHILAETEEAAAFAFGYAQAEDHAAEIGRRYLSARGEEARHFGQSGLSNDVTMAQFDNLAESTAALARITPLYRRIITAYAAGVNQYARGHRAELPPWMPEISAADVLASTRAGAANSLGGAALVRRLREKYEGQPRGEEEPSWIDEAPGSNAFALSGSRTTTGKPILLGNPTCSGPHSTGKRTSACRAQSTSTGPPSSASRCCVPVSTIASALSPPTTRPTSTTSSR
ncbi:MAG: penicillin acylase family protein [Acidobacteria bacterium]|nr:penicillin acylase family protein [Acidobacteriota bacterium]